MGGRRQGKGGDERRRGRGAPVLLAGAAARLRLERPCDPLDVLGVVRQREHPCKGAAGKVETGRKGRDRPSLSVSQRSAQEPTRAPGRHRTGAGAPAQPGRWAKRQARRERRRRAFVSVRREKVSLPLRLLPRQRAELPLPASPGLRRRGLATRSANSTSEARAVIEKAGRSGPAAALLVILLFFTSSLNVKSEEDGAAMAGNTLPSCTPTKQAMATATSAALACAGLQFRS